MKPMYYRKIGYKSAVVDLVKIGEKVFLITRVNVPEEFRGKLIGTSMLNEVISDADSDGVILNIESRPYGEITVEKKEMLIRFYEKFGFKWISDDEYMVREPK